ncbi:MAG TPA: TonB-dependent receptor [Vicinamibacterales bacterium]|nr:TonB-dependent receptor [Vicinamibacterales bacterium]
MSTSGKCIRFALLVSWWLGPAALHAAGPVQSSQPATTGRVVATITTLEGTVHMPGVDVELRSPDQGIVIARTVTDGAGQVTFPDVPPGRYIITASRQGFVSRDSTVFVVRANETAQVILDTKLSFVLPGVQVRPASPSPTDSVQPVSMSDMLAGSLFESAPLEGDDFRSLLPLLPGVVRDANGRLRIRGGQPTQGALQISSASLIDPSSGEFDVDLPAQSVDSVEVLANPFAAEYGRFTTSVTQIRTRGGTNEWNISTGNLVPRFRGLLRGIRGFEPRLSIRGPIRKDRAFLAQDLQFRYVATPVKSLPDEPEVDLRSFDSFTRLDTVVSARHVLGGALIMFPREIRQITMNTFRPGETTPDFNQSGWSAGGVDRFAILPDVVLETTVSLRRFEIDVNTKNHAPMVYAPESQRGGFFNDQERDVTSFQWVQALSLSRNFRFGQHVFKFGSDVQRSEYTGESVSRPVELRRLDGSLAERIEFGPQSTQEVQGTEIGLFAQDRWRLNSRVTFEVGLRADRDAVVEGLTWSPRAGAAVGVLPDGRGIVRGGYGKFVQRTPLNVEAFPSFEPRIVSRFAPDGSPLGSAVTLANVVDGPLRTPEAYVGNIEWDQRFGRRILLKLAFLARKGTHEVILSPDPAAGVLRLSNNGRSRYKELESTIRYLGGERRDLTLSYVWARGTADLNNYDQFYGNFRNPIVRANEHGLVPTDVRHRLLLRGMIGLPGQWDFAPVLELRSGFPWSAVDEFQDFVGPRSRSGRLPAVRTLDFSIVRPWTIKKRRFRAGIKVFNLFGDTAERDIQSNTASPFFGTAFNPVERSIGFVLGTAR